MNKLYFEKSLLDNSYRSEVFPLLKPFLKGRNYTDEDRISDYGVSESDFLFVKSVREADVIILPMSLNFYVYHGKRKLIENYIYSNKDKKILSFMSGDYGVRFPFFSNLNILRSSGYKGKANTYGMPVFIEDAGTKYNISIDKKINEINTIGFCGQSDRSFSKFVFDWIRILRRNFLGFIFDSYEKEKLFSSRNYRYEILKNLKAILPTRVNFVERKKYRAGAVSTEFRQKTTEEYFDNMNNSRYVVCMRGGGNFSVRLYETLCSGRIPIYFHSDDNLPFLKDEFWKSNTIWINNEDIKLIDKRISSFESSRKMEEVGHQNRLYWSRNLTLDGYFKRIFNEI